MKIYVNIVLFLIGMLSVSAQDSIYLDSNKKEISKYGDYKYYKILIDHPNLEKVSIEKIYQKNNTLESERNYRNYYKNKELLYYSLFYNNGKIHISSEMKNGKRDGYFMSYWENGKTKRKDLYKKGELVEGICFNENGESIEYYEFEIQPEFPGGSKGLNDYFRSNINYSAIPAENKGKSIKVRFSVSSTGSIENIEILKGLDLNSNLEAIRLIEAMPKWTPAYQDGNPIEVKRTIPLTF